MVEVGLSAKADRIDRLAQLGAQAVEGSGQPRERVQEFLTHYFRHVDSDDVLERATGDLFGLVLHHYHLAGERPPATPKIDVFTPTAETDGWTAGGATVCQIVTDDQPFLVDSVTMEVVARGWSIRQVFHPQYAVRRDVTGRLGDIVSTAEADADASIMRESWMHLEILPPAEAEANAPQALADGLRSVLQDVSDAVQDWQRMRGRAEELASALAETAAPPYPLGTRSAQEAADARELLEWLVDNHFTFLGARDYVLRDGGYELVPATGLGILRSDTDEPGTFDALPQGDGDDALMVITKGDHRSTVHRPAYLDYVGLRTFDEEGRVTGERRFLGLFASLAYSESVSRIPLLRAKAAELLRRSGYAGASHGAKAIMDVLDTYPRDELFQASVSELQPVVERIAGLRERRQVSAFPRIDRYGRYLSCLVYLPRDRYTTRVRNRMEDLLLATVGGASIDYTARVSESVLARLHFVVRATVGERMELPDLPRLERELTSATRTWSDDFTDAAAARVVDEGEGRAVPSEQLITLANRLPDGYREDFTARQAMLDITALHRVINGQSTLPDLDDQMDVVVYTPEQEGDEADLRMKIFRSETSLKLSTVLPHLSLLGVEVIDERPYELTAEAAGRAWIYDFGLRIPGGRAARDQWTPEARSRFTAAFEASYSGLSEADRLNQLVLTAGLTWPQVAWLRTISRYLRQTGSTWSQTYVAAALLANVELVDLLVRLFRVKFDPDLAIDDRDAEATALRAGIDKALNDVASLDYDRIIRSFVAVIDAAVRTNAFRPGTRASDTPDAIAIKLLPQRLPDLPEPKPEFEIFVCSPRVEGVHLRFGLVSRGGLRWSDRAEDFRTEILGLVKAQMVKNTVIVPVGAKGGFYCKDLPDPANGRDAWLAEGVACYETFITALLSVTDNIVDGAVVHPDRVLRHDADDPYLVVAADKGTASFSDLANRIAVDSGYWLGDAFASGGSAGYDHKEMGITAKGAWQSVIRHFREIGVDCQTEDFTCVGIGDMSGDVFGNGMLLSRHIRLVAAFDHRHVFIDPDPDPETSWTERQRLYDLPRSSWGDYDASLISNGGGVFPRTMKSITITPEMRAALGMSDDVTRLRPAQLISAILTAPVDLLWNGGIGTYVKASSETNAAVGDKANDQLRVNGSDLRAQCVGEGGNLGFTQLGRIEYAAAGGKINTDAIDNSAGVDTSDHEVNIKILLAAEMAAGRLTLPERDRLLAQMTDEVARLVLSHNVNQNVALANADFQAPSMARVHEDWMQALAERGYLNRAVEFMPTTVEMEARIEAGRGLTSPELSTLLAHTKIFMADAIVASELPDDPYLANRLVNYFPAALRERYADEMPQHRLHREIIATVAINRFVDSAGISCYHRLSLETGAEPADVIRAQLVARALYGAGALENKIAALDHRISASMQTRLRLEVRTLVERATRWILNTKRTGVDIIATVDQMGAGVALVQRELPNVVLGRDRQAVNQRLQDYTMAGVGEDLARQVATLPEAYGALTVVRTALRDHLDVLTVVRTHLALGQLLGLDQLLTRIIELPRSDRWQTQARATLRDDLHSAHAQLTAQVLTGGADDSRIDRPTSEDPAEACGQAVERWRERTLGVDKAVKMLAEICADTPDLARMSVGLRVVRSLLR